MVEITLGGGCFWCIEAVFYKIKGIQKTTCGYMGGTSENPTYEEVCSGKTSHIEVVKIKYDEKIITLENILEIFFQIHDPTTLDRQGNDIGTQYHSVIFYHDDIQRDISIKYIKSITLNFKSKIITSVKPKEIFYKAEEYHQNFYNKNINYGYCKFVILPKICKIKQNIN